MSITRRAALIQLAISGLVVTLLQRQAQAQTYKYDTLGRVVEVEHNGSVVTYTYDASGNRTQVVRASSPPSPPPPLPPPPPAPPPTFTQTIQITGTSPVNLRTLANTNGYVDAQNASITFEIGSGVATTGAPGGGTAIDTGLWPTGSKSVSLGLVVKNGGAVRGGGGSGGPGGSIGDGVAGGNGGDAIYCRVPLSVTVQSGGELRAGGGGGGGGATVFEGFPEPELRAGGGGGGGAPNGPGGDGASGAGSGGSGATSGGGGGGSGGNGGAIGGNGGTYATAGSVGGSWLSPPTTGGAGGAPGFAIRKNGHNVPVTNNGTISGAVA